jgi:hypothetical protein
MVAVITDHSLCTKINMAAYKPEVPISWLLIKISQKFQRLHIGVFQHEHFNKHESSSGQPFPVPKIQNGCLYTGSTYILITRQDISEIPMTKMRVFHHEQFDEHG